LIPVVDLLTAREKAKRGDHDDAIVMIREASSVLHRGEQNGWMVFTASILVEALMERGEDSDLTEAQEVIDQLSHQTACDGWAIRDIWLLRLRTLLAGARGDDAASDLLTRYRAMAESLGFEGHIAWAEAMIV
jgi:hypothetical protein